MAFSFVALSLHLQARTSVPGAGSSSIWVPPRLNQMPPEASIWLATMTLAPAVPRKVIVCGGGFASFSTVLLLFSNLDWLAIA